MQRSYVATGAARGVGRAIVERLAADAGTALVVVIDREAGPPLPGTQTVAAAVVAHLLSADASFLTGAVVPVDGGRAARGRDPEEV